MRATPRRKSSHVQTATGAGHILAETITKSFHDRLGVFLAEGILLCVLGLGAIVVPPIAGLATDIFLGWLFLV